eukprot:3821194-Rhodomonas_salina.1
MSHGELDPGPGSSSGTRLGTCRGTEIPKPDLGPGTTTARVTGSLSVVWVCLRFVLNSHRHRVLTYRYRGASHGEILRASDDPGVGSRSESALANPDTVTSVQESTVTGNFKLNAY